MKDIEVLSLEKFSDFFFRFTDDSCVVCRINTSVKLYCYEFGCIRVIVPSYAHIFWISAHEFLLIYLDGWYGSFRNLHETAIVTLNSQFFLCAYMALDLFDLRIIIALIVCTPRVPRETDVSIAGIEDVLSFVVVGRESDCEIQTRVIVEHIT